MSHSYVPEPDYFILIVIVFAIVMLTVLFIGLVANTSPQACYYPKSMECRTHEMKVCVDSGLYTQSQCANLVAIKFGDPTTIPSGK